MRSTLFILIALCMVAACRAAAEEEYEYEDEPAPAPVTQAPARPAGRLGSLLAPRGRATPARGKSAVATSTTAKPVELVEEEIEEGEEIVEDSQEQEEAQPTTTESAKKLLSGGVRPFRSNQDLLAALKRRRAQAGTVANSPSTTQASAEPTTPKAKTSSGGRSRNGAVSETSRTSTRGRFGSNTRGNKPVQEEVEETQQEEVQVKAKPYRRG